MNRIAAHFRRHMRFYGSALLGVAVYFLVPGLKSPVRLIAAGDGFFVAYLFAMGLVVAEITARDLYDKGEEEDEGIFLVILIALTVIAFCCVGIVAVLNSKKGPEALHLALAVACAPLGWLTLHTIAAFHYANLYYARGPDAKASRRGLDFPHTKEPGVWEFLYFSFVVGMTAQTSDIQVLDTKLRRATLGHSIVSFFFNTAIIAMAVNAVVAVAS